MIGILGFSFFLASIQDELNTYGDILVVANDRSADRFKVLSTFMETMAFHLANCGDVKWYLTVDQNVFVNTIQLYRYSNVNSKSF